jgi:hypothetical protein
LDKEWEEVQEDKYLPIYNVRGNVWPPVQKTCVLCGSTSHTHQDCLIHILTMSDLNAVDIADTLLKCRLWLKK